MRYLPLILVFAMSLTTVEAGYAQTVKAPSANELAKIRAMQLRSNIPLSKLSTTQAKPYTILSQSDAVQEYGLLWIEAPSVSNHIERVHTLMKAAEDFYNEHKVSPIYVHMPILPKHIGYMHQATGFYDAEKRIWRASAFDGPAIPAWKIQITEDWYDLIDSNGKLTVPEAKAKDDIGRLRNISPSHVSPLEPLTLTPFIPQ